MKNLVLTLSHGDFKVLIYTFVSLGLFIFIYKLYLRSLVQQDEEGKKSEKKNLITQINILVFGFIFSLPFIGYLKEEFIHKTGDYDEVVKITGTRVSNDNEYRYVYLSNGKQIKCNRFWESYMYNVGDSIYVKYIGDTVIYAGNKYRKTKTGLKQ